MSSVRFTEYGPNTNRRPEPNEQIAKKRAKIESNNQKGSGILELHGSIFRSMLWSSIFATLSLLFLPSLSLSRCRNRSHGKTTAITTKHSYYPKFTLMINECFNLRSCLISYSSASLSRSLFRSHSLITWIAYPTFMTLRRASSNA